VVRPDIDLDPMEDRLMLGRSLIVPLAVAALLSSAVADAVAFDESKYPDWSG